MVRIYLSAATNVSGQPYGFLMVTEINPDLALLIGLITALVANAVGRSFFLWLFLGYLFPLVAPFALLIFHLRNPKESSHWITYWNHRIKTKIWSKGLRPEDFKQPPDKDGPAL